MIANGVQKEMKKEKMKLVDNVIRAFRPAKVFRENSDRVNHMNFSPNGDTLITSSEDDSIVIYDCLEGKLVYTSNEFTKLNSSPMRFF